MLKIFSMKIFCIKIVSYNYRKSHATNIFYALYIYIYIYFMCFIFIVAQVYENILTTKIS